MASYMAGQRGRNYTFYTEYGSRRQYASLWNFLKKGSFFDMEYIYDELSRRDGENPLDYPALRDNPMDLYIVAADAATGRARCFEKRNLWQDHYDILKASGSIPFINKPCRVDERLYYDGGLGDPVPMERAFALGCDKVVLLLTKPVDTLADSRQDERLAARIRRRYPHAAEALCARAQRYNDSVARAKEYARQGRVLIVAPDDTGGVDTLTRDRDALRRLYVKGYGEIGRAHV